MKEERKPQPAGKKSKPNPKYDRDQILKQAMLWVSAGKTLRDFCRQDGMPTFATVYNWLKADEKASGDFQLARDVGHDVIAEECMQIADEMPPCDDKGKMDAGFVSWQKNRIWTRTQLLSKWNPKKYGDKVNLNHEGGVTLNVVTGVPDDD